MQKRSSCFVLIILTIAAGLISRKIHGVPLWIGDVMYAMMMYFIARFILLRKRSLIVAFTSLIACFAIEFSQLYQGEWINDLRATLPGRLVLGQGFLWTDLVAYTLGIAMALALEYALKFMNKQK